MLPTNTPSNYNLNENSYNHWLKGAIIFFLLGSFLLYFFPFFLNKSIWAHDVSYTKEHYQNITLLIKGPLNLNLLSLTFFTHRTTKVILYSLLFSLMFTSGFVFLRSLKIAPLPALIVAYLYTFNPNVFTFIRHGHVDKITLMSLIPFAFAGITYYMKSPSSFKKKIIFNSLLLSSIGVIFGLTNSAAQTQAYIIFLFSAYLVILIITNINLSISSHLNKNNNHLNKPSRLNLFKKLCFNKLIYLIIIPIVFLGTSPHKNIQNLTRLTGNYILTPSKKLNQKEGLLTIIDQYNTTNFIDYQFIRNERSDDNWAFVTRWSIKKLETLSFILPELFGYYSIDEAFPYWGAKGNPTIDLDKYLAGQGVHFSKIYLGLFYVMFLLLGIIYGPREKYFWGAILIITLFLSWGKFFFLYKLFYSIPYMNKIRNPIKFLHVFVLASLPLVAYGAEYFVNSLKSPAMPIPLQRKPYRFFYWGIIFVNLSGLVAFFSIILFKGSLQFYLKHLSPSLVILIYQNILIAILKAVLIINLILGLCFFLLKTSDQPNQSKKVKLSLTLLLCCIAIADLYWINRRFMIWHIDNTFNKDATYETIKQLNLKKKGLLLYSKTNNNYTTFFKNRLEPFFNSPNINYSTIHEPYNLDSSIRHFKLVKQKNQFQKIKQSTFRKITNLQTRYQLFGIGYILSGNKLDKLENNNTLSLIQKNTYNVVKKQVLPESPQHTILKVSPATSQSNTNNLENVFLYKVNHPRSIFHPIKNLILIDKPRETLDIINQTTFDPRKTGIIQREFYQKYSDKLSPFLISSPLSSTITNSDQSIPIEINNIEQISASHYRLKITPQSSPSILDFSLSYYDGWNAYQAGKRLTHFPINRIQNGYIINPKSDPNQNSASESIIDVKIELETYEKIMFGLELSKFIILLLFGIAYFREYKKKTSPS